MSASDMFREEAEQSASFSQTLLALAGESVELERAVELAEEQLKSLKQQLNELKSKRLPDLMAESGFSEMKLPDGTKISITEFVSGSLPKGEIEREQAIRWLTEHGAADIIKTEVKTSFGRNEHNQAIHIAEGLREQGLQVYMESGVHSATLQSFARERLRSGEEIPLDMLGLYSGQVAKIKLGKR